MRLYTPEERAGQQSAARALAGELHHTVVTSLRAAPVEGVMDTMIGAAFLAVVDGVLLAVIVCPQDEDGPLRTYEPRPGGYGRGPDEDQPPVL